MAKTMEIFKAVVMLALVLVPLISASRVEELEVELSQLKKEMIQLKEIVSALQETKVDTIEFTAQMGTKVDVVDFSFKLNDTEELEARVSVLEESVADLEAGYVILTGEVDDVESVNLLQEQTINTLEAEIFDNENDIEELVDITTGLTTQVSSLQLDVDDLDQRVGDLESGGGGGGNVTDLEIRVETLEDMMSQLSDDVSSLEVNDVTQDERISSIEEDVTSLDQRVEDLESGGGGGGNATDYGDTVFLAALSASDSSSADPVLFDWEVINHGGHYNPNTGEYTVPYDGVYQFSVHLAAYNSSASLYFHIYVDGNSIESHNDSYNVQQYYRSTTVLLELQAGQTVSIYRGGGAYGQSNALRSYFSGHMISAN